MTVEYARLKLFEEGVVKTKDSDHQDFDLVQAYLSVGFVHITALRTSFDQDGLAIEVGKLSLNQEDFLELAQQINDMIQRESEPDD